MTHTDNIQGIIKAMTAYGGDCEDYEHFWNDDNIILFNEWMRQQPKVSGITLYRGYTFDESYFNDTGIEVGAVIGEDALTQESLPSFTSDMLRAANYVNEFGETELTCVVKALFVIVTHGKAFVDISRLSYYPEENEYKCTDSVKLKVVAFERKAGLWQITMEEI